MIHKLSIQADTNNHRGHLSLNVVLMSRPQDDRNQEATVYLVSVTLNMCMAKLSLGC